MHVKFGRDKLAEGANAAFETLMGMSAKTSRYGDGFLFAADYLAKKETTEKYLVICGDGQEEGGPAGINLSKGMPKDAMARFLRAGLVPAKAFAGTDISWVGLAGAEAAHLNLIKEFWTEYFVKTGAKKILHMQRAPL